MLNRDQERARDAYDCVARLKPSEVKDYRILVNSLGPNILRSGLVAAVAFAHRDKRETLVAKLFSDLVKAGAPGIHHGPDLPDQIRRLDKTEYMLATREILKFTVWLKRALQTAETSDET